MTQPVDRYCPSSDLARVRPRSFGLKAALEHIYLSYLSRPASDRVLYQAIRNQRAQTILELGVGTGSRALRLIRLAQRYHAAHQVGYFGLDPFEARTAADGPGISLKLAYRTLRATGARIRLLPGEPLAVLAQAANSLGKVDLLIFSCRLDSRLLSETWFYVPRLLHPGSAVFVESLLPGNRLTIRPIAPDEIASLAATRRRAA